MKQLGKAIHAANVKAAASMTERIRSSAISRGWDPEVASKVSLKYDGDKFSVKIDPEYKDKALDFEYGTEGVPPKHAIRQHLLHPTEFDTLLAKHLDSVLKGK